MMSFSGVEAIMDAFEDLDRTDYGKPVFVELLSCSGGCVNGPAVLAKGSTIKKRYSIIDSTIYGEDPVDLSMDEIKSSFAPREIIPTPHEPAEIAAALLRISKKRKEEELNCGGCGYDSCREFAAALLENKAEPAMCVSYLRKLAQNKAAALIKAMPSGLVIVDENLKIIESNRRFIEIIGGDADIVSQADPDLEGAYLERLIPFHDHFSKAITDGTEAKVTDIRYNNKIIRMTVFSIQPHHVVGGIFQDITEPVIQREQIIDKAAEVMKKNLTTVQQIAFLLGENAADSEILLNSIIESFAAKD
jgi:PAS domain-containing protein